METEEFDIYVMPHRDMIFRLAKSMLMEVCEAEDATQDILEKLWRRRYVLSAYDNIGAIVYTTTRNHCIDRLRAHKHKPGSIQDMGQVGSDGTDLMTKVEQRDMKAIVRRIISELPDKQRAVIHLRDIEGYDFDEIAAMTGADEGLIRVTLSRARKSVREKLIKIMDYGAN